MSLPEIRGSGQLLTDPRTGETKTGRPWTSAIIRFQAWRKTDTGWEPGDAVIASVIAFDEEPATALTGFKKGDEAAIQGVVSVGIWQEKAQLKVTAAKVWTPERRSKGTQDVRTPSVGQTPTEGRGRVSGDATQNRRDTATVDRQWPRPAQTGAAPVRHQSRTTTKAPAQRGTGGVVANLREHVARRGAS